MNKNVYIFQGERAAFSSAVFSNIVQATEWIEKNNLSGILTEYILDYPVYDWAVDQGYFKPKSEIDCSSQFIGRFSSAYQKHWHYIHGKTEQE
ncbi:hypothetical protein RFI02_09700 [Acinetobacter sichuanensis]|uniref:DUF7710 domain-containing protein n=1 Tax=Acinetobacter sichuanensis TaxID=2136183 RepID=UPI00280FE613|nr:hypothetical protein [Acinetobacter sichuanensis]MDQ9021378.1 hypothetical protein [Acinetobacter sichuanensis]